MAEEKKKRTAYRAPTDKEYEKLIEAIIEEFDTHIKALFADKKNSEFPEDAPTHTELVAWTKIDREKLVKAYSKLWKLKVHKPTHRQGEDRGFKTPRYANSSLVKFVNNHCDLPDDLHLSAVMDNGNAIFTCAQATSILTDYIERHSLKDKDKKSIIIPDNDLEGLFLPLYSGIKKTKKQEIDGKTCFNHATLQALISRLFVPTLTVLPSKNTVQQKALLKKREAWLKQRTNENKKRREEQKEAEKKARAEAKIVKAK